MAFVVKTAFAVKDKGTLAFFKQMAMQAKTFGRTADKSFKKASKSALGFKSVLGGILSAGVITRGLANLQLGVRALTGEVIDFDQAITSAAAKLDLRRGSRQFKELEIAARDVGATTEFTATQAAKGIDELVKAGFDQAQAMAAIRGTTNLATIANIELEQSAGIAVGALNAFGKAVKNPEERLKNLTDIADMMARTVNSSATDIESLNETMIHAGPVFKTVGSDFATFATMAGAVAKANLKGSIAGTTLKNTMLGLVSITPKAAKVFKKLNIETMDIEGNLKDPIQLMAELSDATKEMGTGMKGAAINTIFGRRAISGVSKVLDLGGDWLRKYRDETIKTGRSAKDVADDMRKSIGNRLAVLKSSAIELGMQFVDAFKKDIPGAIKSATEALRKIDVNQIKEDIRKFFFWLNNVKETIKELKPIIIALVAIWMVYNATLKVMMAIQVVSTFLQMAKAIKAATAAQGLLNVAMAANPAMVLALAIGLLITAAYMLYNAWDDIKWLAEELWRLLQEFIDWAWPHVKAFAKMIWKEFSRLLDNPFFATLSTIFLPFITVPALIIKHWKPIKTFFSNLWSAIKRGFDIVIGPILKWLGVTKPVEVATAAAMAAQSPVPAAPAETRQPVPKAPNAGIEEAKRQQTLAVSGTMTFVNPPPGATFESEFFKAPGIPEESLGYNY